MCSSKICSVAQPVQPRLAAQARRLGGLTLLASAHGQFPFLWPPRARTRRRVTAALWMKRFQRNCRHRKDQEQPQVQIYGCWIERTNRIRQLHRLHGQAPRLEYRHRRTAWLSKHLGKLQSDCLAIWSYFLAERCLGRLWPHRSPAIPPARLPPHQRRKRSLQLQRPQWIYQARRAMPRQRQLRRSFRGNASSLTLRRAISNRGSPSGHKACAQVRPRGWHPAQRA